MEIFLFFMFIGAVGSIFWVWMIIDCATNEPNEGNDKLIWLLIIIFVNFLGALIYFCVRRPRRKELYGN